MKAPELTYQYAQLGDVAGGTLIMAARTAGLADTSTSITVVPFPTIEAGKILIITFATLIAQSGAGQTVSAMLMAFDDDPSGVSFAFQRELDPFAGVNPKTNHAINWSGEAWVPGGGRVLGSATFSSGVNSNQITMYVGGLLIPRGSVQQG